MTSRPQNCHANWGSWVHNPTPSAVGLGGTIGCMSSLGAAAVGGGHFKDAILADLAARANVAQFVSFTPGESELRFALVADPPKNMPATPAGAIEMLLTRATESSVNVRAFEPTQPKSHEFIYGLRSVEETVSNVRRLAAEGLYTIVNETIDVSDGGVSGVAFGGIVEFAPDDTPRCVEKPGVASLPTQIALRILKTVYGFEADLTFPANIRTEFSLHPSRHGLRRTHTLIWELEEAAPLRLDASFEWPNHFSRLVGDKTFGLLVADAIGLHVPRTTVTSRRIAPFSFGSSTDTSEYWLRTAPVDPVPGRYTTSSRWVDPFKLIEAEDREGAVLASVLAQEFVDARYSGAAAASGPAASIVEGVRGRGDQFMLGEVPPEPLPAEVTRDVRESLRIARGSFGGVRLEWVHDGRKAWVVQLHHGDLRSRGDVVFPGVPTKEHRYDVRDGLEGLRSLVESVAGSGDGIVLVGNVGITSHFGDVLRKAAIPARIDRTRLTA